MAAAPATERALLVQGPASNSDKFRVADNALRGSIDGGLGGVEVDVAGAGYASGRQLTGDTGTALGDANGLIFASVMFLDSLAENARLLEGTWPTGGADPIQTVVGERAATVLGLKPGSQVPITDRRTDKVTTVVVSGIFAANNVDDAYWMLTPEIGQGSLPGGSTYGPFVIDRGDFFTGTWPTGGSAAWMVEPKLTGAELDDLIAVREAVRDLPPRLPQLMEMGSGLQVVTSLERLVDRLQRADLVGRSALLTPLLLIVVLGGYALLLLAGLLTEQRRQETALLRARGAARGQLAGLAAREATLIALPAAVLAPLLVAQLLPRIPALENAELHMTSTWVVSAAAAIGCVIAMVLPTLRAGLTYVDDLAAQSRPSKATAAQRAGVDLALIAFAALAWFQLRQYSSPLAGVGGQLGIDPLLAAAAPIGVLAGSVLALRLLPPLTKVAERLIDRRPWFATQLGMWQAGRRPHAGPVLLLALSVAVSTLAWSLAGTAERSTVDQANHFAGADLRLSESSGFAPAGRHAKVEELPGVTEIMPAWRTTLSVGERALSTAFMAYDAEQAGDVVKMRPDLGDSKALFGTMVDKRWDRPEVLLPDGATNLRGRIVASVFTTTIAVFVDEHGAQYTMPLPAGTDATFDITLPRPGLRLSGFKMSAVPPIHFDEDLGELVIGQSIDWSLRDLTAVTPTGESPVTLPQDWNLIGAERQADPTVADGRMTIVWRIDAFDFNAIEFNVGRPLKEDVVPVLVTPQALEALHKKVGEEFSLGLGRSDVTMLIVDSVPSLPGAEGMPAIVADLPSLSNVYFNRNGSIFSVAEWWVATDPAQHTAAATQARLLTNMRVHDRIELAEKAGDDPYGVGARLALFIAALGAIALALVGVAVDVRATARRRTAELAVLHTLGAPPRVLARALVTEQAFLAGLGVLVGLAVGIGVAATMAPLVILTPAAGKPDPEPLLFLQWPPVLATAGLLLLTATAMAGMIALTMRNRLAAAQLRIGADR